MRVLATGLLAAGGVAALTPLSGHEQPGVKVLLIYDMEGITNAVQPADVIYGSPTYEATRVSLVEDVNAAIRGLLAAGATEIVVTDGHGSGNPNPDYILDRMPEGARHEIRDTPYDPYIDAIDRSFTAMVAIAMHSKAAGGGFLAHTYNGHTRWTMGGHEMNESMLVAASAARFGVPLILVTGDDVLGREVAAFSPATEYVVVKTAESVERAVARPRADVSADIEAAAARALRNVAKIPAWTGNLPPRFDNEYGYTLTEYAGVAIGFPGATEVDDKTIRVPATSFLEAYLAFRALAGFTGLVNQRLLLDGVRAQEGGTALLQNARSRLPSRTERSFAPTGKRLQRTYGPHGYR
ncbi:MAG TPA: M55 family metallopeptidase [Vicinamibacterales bacterium]|nr:M55 family metallopeptidase [Vicinamibacterales bacterium]